FRGSDSEIQRKRIDGRSAGELANIQRSAMDKGPMRYWWVNRNETFRQEIAGGYLWSPKRNKGERRNPSDADSRHCGYGSPLGVPVGPDMQRPGVSDGNLNFCGIVAHQLIEDLFSTP